MLIKFEITVNDETDKNENVRQKLLGLAALFGDVSSAVVPGDEGRKDNIVPLKPGKTQAKTPAPEKPKPEEPKQETVATEKPKPEEPKREVKEDRSNGLIPERTTDIPPIEGPEETAPVDEGEAPENVDDFRAALSADFTATYRAASQEEKKVLFEELKRYNAPNIKGMKPTHLKAFRDFLDAYKASHQ